jgi:hypothetical protein
VEVGDLAEAEVADLDRGHRHDHHHRLRRVLEQLGHDFLGLELVEPKSVLRSCWTQLLKDRKKDCWFGSPFFSPG